MATPALVCFVRNFTNMYRKGFLSCSQILDNITLTNLDVIPSGPDASLEGTLLERLDHCCTPFGEHKKNLGCKTLLIFQRIKKKTYMFPLFTRKLHWNFLYCHNSTPKICLNTLFSSAISVSIALFFSSSCW